MFIPNYTFSWLDKQHSEPCWTSVFWTLPHIQLHKIKLKVTFNPQKNLSAPCRLQSLSENLVENTDNEFRFTVYQKPLVQHYPLPCCPLYLDLFDINYCIFQILKIWQRVRLLFTWLALSLCHMATRFKNNYQCWAVTHCQHGVGVI